MAATINNHFKSNPDLSRKGIIARMEQANWRDKTLNENKYKIIRLREEGKTVFEISKIILGDDGLTDMGATGRFVESLPLRRLRCRYG